MDELGSNPLYQPYCGPRFEACVKVAVDHCLHDPQAALRPSALPLPACACPACDCAVARAAASGAHEEACELVDTDEAGSRYLPPEHWEFVLNNAATEAAAALKGRVWSQPAADCAIPTPCEAATNEAPGPLSKDHLDALHADRLVVVERWLPAVPAAALAAELRALAASGYLQPTPQKRVGVRDDAIGWLTTEEAAAHAGAATAAVVQRLRALGAVLQAHSDTAIRVPSRVMATQYPGEGARYIAHRDNDGGDDHTAHRAWTCILYANEGWQPTDGGALRCYPRGCGEDGDGDGDGVVTVAPAAGTLVIFDSRRLLHEVLPAYAPRYAVTLWLEDTMDDS